jgi:hypothetical protein
MKFDRQFLFQSEISISPSRIISNCFRREERLVVVLVAFVMYHARDPVAITIFFVEISKSVNIIVSFLLVNVSKQKLPSQRAMPGKFQHRLEVDMVQLSPTS